MKPVIEPERIRDFMKLQGMTQAGLAAESGVSRPQLSRILQQDQATVQAGTLDRLSKALRCDRADLLARNAIREFCQAQSQEYGYVDFRSLGMPGIERLPVQDVFVDVGLDEELVSSLDCSDNGPDRHGFRSPPRPAIATSLECIQSMDRVVLLGHPGSGKTTVLRYFVSQSHLDDVTPVLVRLPEFARYVEMNPHADILQFVASRDFARRISGIHSSLEKQASAGRCQFFLDGLDEVGGQKMRELTTDALQKLIDGFPRSRFVITSRIVGFTSEHWRKPGFGVYRLRGYRQPQLDEFADKWSRILANADHRSAEAIRADLQRAIFTHSRVRALASNPLVLTILVLLNESRGGGLPRRRIDLYEKVVDVFLETWETSKQCRAELDDVSGIDLDAREFRWMLSDVSLAMQKADLTLAARWWLADRVQDYLCSRLGFMSDEAKQASDRIIRYLTERTGILTERGPDQFGFSHRTLQEYFASLGVIDESDASSSRDVSECLREYFFHPQWSEVVRLTAAQLTPPVAENLIASILDDPDPVGRFLRRGPFLALNCLADGTTVANRKLIGSLFEQLQSLGKSRWLGITMQAFEILEGFDGTRHAESAVSTIEAILTTAQAELDSEEFEALDGRAHWAGIPEQINEQISSAPQDVAAWELNVDFRGRSQQVVVLNLGLRSKAPEKWYRAASDILEADDVSLPLKLELIRNLRQRVATDPRARMRLKKLLAHGLDPEIRSACAAALSPVATGRHNVKRVLLKALRNDPAEKVRQHCAASLRAAADADSTVMNELIRLLKSDPSDAIRVGAARGLCQVAGADRQAFDAIRTSLIDESSSAGIRAACVWSLSGLLDEKEQEPELVADFRTLAESQPDSISGRSAAQALTAAMAEERIPWDSNLVDRLQQRLMELEDPCPHALDCLEQIATAREHNRGFRLEAVIREALEPVNAEIAYAFIFGSTARKQQQPESDIDLMLIGDVRLRAVSPLLTRAEQLLGRRINPAIYSCESFCEKYQSGDPFLMDVMRRRKLPVHAGINGINEKELDSELRELVAERLADA